jgi:hypothetical protein
VVTLDGSGGRPVAVNGTLAIDNVAPGDHAVGLEGLAANCSLSGSNPRTATVPAGGTGTASFAVQCAATTGNLAVAINGLPTGADAAVTVSGPSGFEAPLTAGGTLTDLAPGQYTIAAAPVTAGGETWTPAPASDDVTVTAGATASATIAYSLQPHPSLDLSVAGAYLTQSVQTFDGTVPLVTGRDAFLRVFVVANEANTETPAVRVRVYDAGNLQQTFTLTAPGASTPTVADEGTLDSSWNVTIPGALIQPGLEIMAEVDPAGAIAEGDESNNRFPATGRQAITVRTTPPLALTLVPVLQSATGLTGRVNAGNQGDYLNVSRRIYPIPGYSSQVHAVFTTAGPLQPDDANGAWGTLLSEVDALRVAEGTSRLYYGVVQLDYTGGQTARSITGSPAAVGFDRPSERSRMAAHELGHMWGRDHAPCTATLGLDPNYPYPGGQIGVFGFNLEAGALQPPSTPDVMGLCQNVWISDYTWRGVMDFIAPASSVTAASAGDAAVSSLLVWGRIEAGVAVLEPAFQVVTRPVLPGRAGAYTLEGTTVDGGRAFRLSFDPRPSADGARGSRHFAFAVPLDATTAGRLAQIRLSGPGLGAVTRSPAPAAVRIGPAAAAPTLSATANGTALRWDAAANPAVMVRDAATGQVLSFARGGQAVLPAGTGEVELELSDGVRSRHQRVRAGP